MCRCRLWGLGLLTISLLLAGCGGGTETVTTSAGGQGTTTAASGASTTSLSAATTTTTGGPAASATTATTAVSILPPTVEIAWFGVGQEFPVFRFLAYVTNPNPFPLQGVEVHWEALNADGVILRDYSHRFPVIDAGFSFPYVGGAGDTSVAPASVEIFVDDQGRAAEGAASTVLTVSDVTLGPPVSYSGNYSPTAVVDAPDHVVRGSQIKVAWVYYDAGGTVIGAEFGSSTALPDQIRPGTRFMVDDYVMMDPELRLLSGEPASVGVFVYEDA